MLTIQGILTIAGREQVIQLARGAAVGIEETSWGLVLKGGQSPIDRSWNKVHSKQREHISGKAWRRESKKHFLEVASGLYMAGI